MEKNLLEICDLNLSYHTKQSETVALKDLSFSVKETELVSIVGPSGCGKRFWNRYGKNYSCA